jgi:predicted ATPase
MDIEYSFRYRKVYLSHPITSEEFIHIFDNWEEPFRQAGSRRKSAPWGHKKFPEIRDNPNNIDLIVHYLNRIRDDHLLKGRGRIRYSIDDNSLVDDWKAIHLLTELDIMTYPTIRVYKRQGDISQNYLFEESSSGETNMLCQFINILSRIEQHSLVLIDEPETSAHPDWLVRYIDWLNQIFERFNTCHFIISTHSHFLLTDIRKESSAIVALKKKDGEVVNISEGINTFCWSVDDILYKVFKVRNTRNRAFENDLMRLYELMKVDSSENKLLARSIMNSLQDVALNDGDPLLYLLERGRKYVESES